MKSIRRSLILYFLLMLALALALVGFLVYQMTNRVLSAGQIAAEQLRMEQYEDQVRQELAQRDLDLLVQARALAGMTQSQVQWQRIRDLSLSPLGAISAGMMPYGYVQMPIWLAQGVRSPLLTRMQRMIATELQLNEDFLPHPGVITGQEEFFQVTTEWGNEWRSRSLIDQSLPLNFNQWKDRPIFDWRFDEVFMPGVGTVRRVVLKAPLTRFRFLWPDRPPRDPNRRGPPPPPPTGEVLTVPAVTRGPSSDRVTESALPSIFIQCAWDTAPHEERFAELEMLRDTDLEAIAVETRNALTLLRNQFLWIALGTFIMVVGGGALLIRSGLTPLHRLSIAVSQVSERDFHLSIERGEMPVELLPIIDRLEQTLTMLKSAFEREKQSVADISHELRTPVASLLTTIEVILRKPRSTETYVETLQDCRLITKQLSHLVERVMTLACLDAGTIQLREQSLDAAELLDTCTVIVRPLADANDVRVYIERDQSLMVTTDPDKLREILTNLLHNAVEYNRPGGEVNLIAHTNAHSLEIEVRDSGIGMSQDVMDRIFERFYRQDPSRQATGIHAGLGLAIVHEYVTRLGGTIAVESTLGVGSRFRLHFPLRVDGTPSL